MHDFERFYIEIAGLCVEIYARYPFAYSHCRDYLSQRVAADFSVSVSPSPNRDYFYYCIKSIST